MFSLPLFLKLWTIVKEYEELWTKDRIVLRCNGLQGGSKKSLLTWNLRENSKHTMKHHIYFILNTAKYKEYLGQTH